MDARKQLAGPAAFLAGFLVIGMVGKGVNGYLLVGMKTYVPNGIFLQGLVLGALSGFLAMGLVLVYRTNRIINFAQGSLGAFGATGAAELVQRFGWPFYPAVIVGIAAAVASSALVEIAIIRRFSKAPRLILTVATIGVAQILGAIELIIPAVFNEEAELETGFNTPISKNFKFGEVFFTGDHIFVLVLTPFVIIGLLWFLKGTGYGLAARAAAENADRARLLGVRVKRVSLIVWSLAGFLSALTAILRAPIVGFQFGALSGFTLLLQALAAGVIGRMESLPITFGAAVLIGVADQVLFFGTSRSGPQSGLLLLAIIVSLLVQRRRVGRLEEAGSSWQAVHEVRPVPKELRNLPEVQWLKWGLGAVAVLVLSWLPFLLPGSRASLVSVVMIYAMVGVSLVILTGWSGNVSLGQWAIVGVGALIAQKMATADAPQDFFVILLVAAVAGSAVAVVIGLPALRIRGLFLGVTTLAFALATGSWIFGFRQLTSDRGIQRPLLFGRLDISSEKDFYFVCLAGLLLALGVGRNLRRARIGRVLIGIRDNERQAQAMGVPIVRTKLLAFAASGFIAALAGALYAYHQQTLRADRFPAEVSVLIFSMVVIGGMGSLSGAILGAVYIRGTQYFLPAEYQLLATGVGVLFLLLLFPGGLGQILYGFRDNYLRWVAKRRRLLVPSLIADKRVIDLSEGLAPGTAAILQAEIDAEADLVTTTGSTEGTS